jgi:phenylacetate-coenzyme A ligase PaaK-like adenylate-forming protein
MNTQVHYQRRRLADVASALRLARTQTSREQGPRAQLAQHQQHRLETVVRHAATHSPFYRRWFAETGPLGEGPVELRRLPVLDKSLLMEHFDELVCDPRLRRDQLLDRVSQVTRDQLYLGRYRVLLTSGSSGRPGLFVYDAAGWRSIGAQFVRSSSWAGLRPSLPRQRMAWLGGAAPSHLSRQGAATMAIGLHRALALPVTLHCRSWSRRSTSSSPPTSTSTPRWPCGWPSSSRPAACGWRPRCWSPPPSCALRR